MQDLWLPGWDNSAFSSQALIPFKSPSQMPLPTRREPNPPIPLQRRREHPLHSQHLQRRAGPAGGQPRAVTSPCYHRNFITHS